MRHTPPAWAIAHPRATVVAPESTMYWRITYGGDRLCVDLGQFRYNHDWFCGVSAGDSPAEAIDRQLRREHRGYLDALDDIPPTDWPARAAAAKTYAEAVGILSELLALAVEAIPQPTHTKAEP